MKKRLAVVVALTVVLVLAMAVPALAKPDKDVHGKLVVDVTYVWTNNYAWSPTVGVWGLMDQFFHVHVYQTGEQSYRQEYSFEGRWRTWAGWPSPGAGIPQKHSGSGVVSGHGTLTFDTPALEPQNGFATRGYIGTFDLGGKRADKGSPAMFPPGLVSFGSWYFPGGTYTAFVDLAQTYRYGRQSFVQSLTAPGWPPSFAFEGDIVIH